MIIELTMPFIADTHTYIHIHRVVLTQLHAATVFLGVVCATLGGVAIFLNKASSTHRIK